MRSLILSKNPLVAAIAVVAAVAACPAHSSGMGTGTPGAIEPLLEGSFEFGGDNIATVYYRHGYSQDIRAGQGGTISVGLHYRIPNSPWDFAGSFGYKFMRTASYDAHLGIDRFVFKLTGTCDLGNDFWLNFGPVLHTNTKFDGDGYVPDIKFNDAVGGTVGIGWRWVGITYTNIKYHSDDIVGSVDGSSGGVTFIWKF